MALQKQKQNSTGHLSDYWRILHYSINHQDRMAVFTAGLYRNQASRNGGAVPIEIVEFIFQGNHFVFSSANLSPLDMNPIKLAYQRIKAGAFNSGAMDPTWFSDAVDVVEANELNGVNKA